MKDVNNRETEDREGGNIWAVFGNAYFICVSNTLINLNVL